MADLCVQVDNEISNMIQHRYLHIHLLSYSLTILLIHYPTYSLSYSFTTLLIHYPKPLFSSPHFFDFFIFFINNIYYFLHSVLFTFTKTFWYLKQYTQLLMELYWLLWYIIDKNTEILSKNYSTISQELS